MQHIHVAKLDFAHVNRLTPFHTILYQKKIPTMFVINDPIFLHASTVKDILSTRRTYLVSFSNIEDRSVIQLHIEVNTQAQLLYPSSTAR